MAPAAMIQVRPIDHMPGAGRKLSPAEELPAPAEVRREHDGGSVGSGCSSSIPFRSRSTSGAETSITAAPGLAAMLRVTMYFPGALMTWAAKRESALPPRVRAIPREWRRRQGRHGRSLECGAYVLLLLIEIHALRPGARHVGSRSIPDSTRFRPCMRTIPGPAAGCGSRRHPLLTFHRAGRPSGRRAGRDGLTCFAHVSML